MQVCTLIETMAMAGKGKPDGAQLQELKKLCKRSVSTVVVVAKHQAKRENIFSQ